MNFNSHHISRREFARLSAGVFGATLAGGFAPYTAEARRRNVPLGVQLYSVRHELADDVPGTIAQLAEMGFEGVEFADYFGRSAAEWRALLDDHGLKCCGTHLYIEEMEGDRLEETVAFNHTLGNPYLIIRWISEDRRDSHDTFLRTAELFNEIGGRLAPHGMRLGYHNHDYIFQTFNGRTLWDILAEHTREDFVLQLDTGHAARFGKDVVKLIERHPGRTASMHVKPYAVEDEAAFIGDDDIDWAGVVEAAERVGGIEWYILEYEIEGVPPLDALEACLANFRMYLDR